MSGVCALRSCLPRLSAACYLPSCVLVVGSCILLFSSSDHERSAFTVQIWQSLCREAALNFLLFRKNDIIITCSRSTQINLQQKQAPGYSAVHENMQQVDWYISQYRMI